MATELQRQSTDLYEVDFYAWALEQARLLQAGQYGSLDLDKLIEEIEGLADIKKSAVLSSARVVIEHLLKLQHSPAQDPRKVWAESVIEHRARIEDELTPRLNQILADQLPEVYVRARRVAARKLRLYGGDAAADALPAECPYSVDQITGDWWP